MISTGLVSITFRGLQPADIIDLVSRAGLAAIEWGGDVHVPHGDLETAREVNTMMRDAGLTNCSYGSYYRLAESAEKGLSFSAVLETAQALEAPVIRVWAGHRSPADADAAYWEQIVEEARQIGDQAAECGIRVGFEFHGGTLTETEDTTCELLEKIGHNNVFTYWQPPHNVSHQRRLNSLKKVLPYLANLHVFYWVFDEQGGLDRRPLKEGKNNWKDYLDVVAQVGGEHYALLEFVREADQQQFLEDAAVLQQISP